MLKTALSWSLGIAVALPLAGAAGAFAGWCLGIMLGSGFELVGWADAGGKLGKVGTYGGAVFGFVRFLYLIARSPDATATENSRPVGPARGRKPPCG